MLRIVKCPKVGDAIDMRECLTALSIVFDIIIMPVVSTWQRPAWARQQKVKMKIIDKVPVRDAPIFQFTNLYKTTRLWCKRLFK